MNNHYVLPKDLNEALKNLEYSIISSLKLLIIDLRLNLILKD